MKRSKKNEKNKKKKKKRGTGPMHGPSSVVVRNLVRCHVLAYAMLPNACLVTYQPVKAFSTDD